MAINNNRDKQRTRVVYVPVNTGGSRGGSQEKIKVGESGLKFANTTFTEIPEVFDFSDVTNLSAMFQGCKSLTTAPQMDTSKVTDMRQIFYGCSSLTTIPEMDTSKVTNMGYMFSSCSLLTSIPKMDTSKVTDMGSMFDSCSSLTSIPEMDTSRVSYMNNMFSFCSSLTNIPEMDASSVSYADSMFTFCLSLTDIGGFIGLKVNIKLSYCPLTHDSLMNVINKAADVTASPATMTLGADNLAKLSDEEKGIATAKGWTLA